VLVFVLSLLTAAVFTFKGRADSVLVYLFFFSLMFALSTYFHGSLTSRARMSLQLAYALLAISISGFRMVTLRRSGYSR
jgi:hypothetical protein